MFPIMQKVENDDLHKHPVYSFLKKNAGEDSPNILQDSMKFFVSKQGKVIKVIEGSTQEQ